MAAERAHRAARGRGTRTSICARRSTSSQLINDEDARVAPAVRAAAPELAAAIDAIAARMELGGRLVYVGAGTSGRLAAADAAECCPTFGLRRRSRRRAHRSPTRQTRTTTSAGAAAVAARRHRRRRCRRGALRERRDAVRPRRSRRPRSRRADRGRGVHAKAPSLAGSPTTRSSRSPGRGAGGLDADEGRHRAEARAEHDLDGFDDPARTDLREPDGRRRRRRTRSCSARARRTVALATGVSDAESRRGARGREGDVKVAIVSLLSGLDADDARRRLEAAGRSDPARAGGAHEARSRGRGRGRRPAARATSRSRTARSRRSGLPGGGSGIAIPGLVDLQVNGFGGVDFASTDAAGYRRAGEALLECGVTAFQPTLTTAPEERAHGRARRDPGTSRSARASSARTSRARSSRRSGSARIRSRRAGSGSRAARAPARGGPGHRDDARTRARRRAGAHRPAASRAASSCPAATPTRPRRRRCAPSTAAPRP